jgi:hypothetical protein
MKNLPVWYGWIPILSGKLFLPKEEDIEDRAKRLQKEINENYEYQIEYTHKELDSWIIKTETKKEKLETCCKLKNNGLCKIIPITGNPSYENILVIYQYIRDLYHRHIHHSGDIPLHPIEANNENDAIEGILDQYRQKVRDYHSEAKDFIDLRRFDEAIDTISSGRGEMQYAKSFVNLFLVGEQRALLTMVFENSDKSLEVLLQKVTQMLSMREHKSILIGTIGTLILVFLTVLLVYQALIWIFNIL